MENTPKKLFLAGNAIKSLVFALISVSLVVGNFFLERQMADGGEFDKELTIGDNYGFLLESAEETLKPSMEIVVSDESQNIFKLNSGKIWADFTVSKAKSNIWTEKVVVIPQNAVFDLSLNENKLEMNVFEGSVVLGFLPENADLKEYQDIYSPIFINRLLVPRETQVIIPVKKLDERIAPLLYTKLVKEFKYSAIPQSLRDSAWVQENMKRSSEFVESIKQNIIADILKKGTSVKEGLLSDFAFWAEEKLIFVPDKKQEKVLDHLFDYLDDAIFYANAGDQPKVDENLAAFDLYLAGLSVEENEIFYKKLDNYIDSLRVFSPDENEYKVYRFLMTKKLLTQKGHNNVMQLLWSDFDRTLGSNEALAEQAFDSYLKAFERTLKAYGEREIVKTYLTYQNQLFDNLLLKYPLFYKDAYFAIKGGLEKELLATYESGQLKSELQQALVSNKINFLKRLRQYLFEGELEVQETKEIFKRLVREIDELTPQDDGVAVTKLFKEQLADIYDFWGYLNETGYHSLSYGPTHKERYQIYLKEKDTIWSFIDLKEDVLGEVSSEEITEVDVVDEIEEILKTHEDISDLEIGQIDSPEQRYVKVKLVLGGYPLNATFDRDTATLKDVEVYGELVIDRSVKIDSLLAVLQTKFADLAKELELPEEEVTLETSAQRFARAYIAKKIAEFGFIATLENVSVVDELNAVYRIEGAGFGTFKDLKVTFDIVMTEEITTNIFMVMKSGPRVIEGKYTLEELAELMVKEYEGKSEETDSGNAESLVDGSSDSSDSEDSTDEGSLINNFSSTEKITR